MCECACVYALQCLCMFCYVYVHTSLLAADIKPSGAAPQPTSQPTRAHHQRVDTQTNTHMHTHTQTHTHHSLMSDMRGEAELREKLRKDFFCVRQFHLLSPVNQKVSLLFDIITNIFTWLPYVDK